MSVYNQTSNGRQHILLQQPPLQLLGGQQSDIGGYTELLPVNAHLKGQLKNRLPVKIQQWATKAVCDGINSIVVLIDNLPFLCFVSSF